jgi:hypothetical protein
VTRSRALVLFVCCLIWNSPVLAATITVNAGGGLQTGEQAIRLVLDTNGTSGISGNFIWIAME